MKRWLYIALFTFLGLLLSTLLHVALEWPFLWLLENDPERYVDSWVWQHWDVVHGGGAIVLWLIGPVIGFLLGRRYWRILYIEKRYGPPRW